MDRRLALKNLALFAGGLAALPACDFSRPNIIAAYEKLRINEDHLTLLRKLVDVIIPETDLKGAEELGVHDFVLVMANDCLAKEDQDRFVQGLKGFSAFVKEKYGSSWEKMEQAKAESTFTAILDQKAEEDLTLEQYQYFLKTTKKFTIQGYLSSEYVMTELMTYQLVPGPQFDGAKPIVPGEKINING